MLLFLNGNLDEPLEGWRTWIFFVSYCFDEGFHVRTAGGKVLASTVCSGFQV